MSNRLSGIVRATLLVGTLDILAAFIYYYIISGDSKVANVLKYIASGIFGTQAFSGGSNMLLVGLLAHYVIALAFTAFFFWLYPKLNLGSKNKILIGIAYGLFIWVVMNVLVVPLSMVPHQPFSAINAIINLIILIVCIGLPLSFMANTYYRHTN